MTLQRHRGLTEPAADAAIDTACRVLRLPTLRAQFTDLADAAAREQMTYRGFLAELLMAECDDRGRRRSERRIKAACFPRQKELRTFDFQANPNITPETLSTLATCEWVRKGQPLCLIGDSGTGKSHLPGITSMSGIWRGSGGRAGQVRCPARSSDRHQPGDRPGHHGPRTRRRIQPRGR